MKYFLLLSFIAAGLAANLGEECYSDGTCSRRIKRDAEPSHTDVVYSCGKEILVKTREKRQIILSGTKNNSCVVKIIPATATDFLEFGKTVFEFDDCEREKLIITQGDVEYTICGRTHSFTEFPVRGESATISYWGQGQKDDFLKFVVTATDPMFFRTVGWKNLNHVLNVSYDAPAFRGIKFTTNSANYASFQVCPGNCGTRRRGRRGRVFGGIETTAETYPFFARIEHRFQHNQNPAVSITTSCGGSIINSKTILTAAHCLGGTKENATSMGYTAVIGRSKLDQITKKEQRIPADGYKQHPGYSTTGEDIALLYLKEDIVWGPSATPICLSPPLRASEVTHLVGFGKNEEETKVLKDATMLVGPEECSSTEYRRKMMLPHKEFQTCPTVLDGNSCYGDSGGPLAYSLRNKYYQIALISQEIGGHGCGGKEGTIDTNTSYFNEFIKRNVKSGHC